MRALHIGPDVDVAGPVLHTLPRAQVRTAGATEGHDVVFDPATETIESLLRRLHPWTPDVIFLDSVDCHIMVAEIHKAPCLTVLQAGDWNLWYDCLRRVAPSVDLVIVNARHDVPKFADLAPTVASPLYGGNPAYAPDGAATTGADRDLDVVFVGNLNPDVQIERTAFIQQHLLPLQKRYRMFIGQVYGPEYYQLLARAKLVFNRSIRSEVNKRVFEALGCGALVLLEEGNQQLAEYPELQDCVVTYTAENLVEQLDYWLTHEAEREARARHGQALVCAAHTPYQRYAAFQEIVRQARPRTRQPLSPVDLGAVYFYEGHMAAAVAWTNREREDLAQAYNNLGVLSGGLAYFVQAQREKPDWAWPAFNLGQPPPPELYPIGLASFSRSFNALRVTFERALYERDEVALRAILWRPGDQGTVQRGGDRDPRRGGDRERGRPGEGEKENRQSPIANRQSATISVVIPEAILPWALDYASALVLGLQELGHEVALVKAAAPRGLGQRDLVWVVPPHGFVEMGTQDLFERVPGVIYAAWNLEQTPQSDRDLNNDTLHRWRQTMDCLEDYDFMFLDCPAKADYFRSKGWSHVYSMGLGYHPYFTRDNVHHPPSTIHHPPFDVCFYGAGKPRRVAILEALLQAGVTLHPCYGQLTFGEDLFRAIAQSKIVLNIHHNEMNAFEKPRIIQEALANGAFVLTETIDHLEGFQPGVHLGMAAYGELVDAVRYYLDHDEERQQIARQGFEYVSTQVLLKTEVERALGLMLAGIGGDG